MYYIGAIQCNPNYLEHHGILGMKWGVRRYQNQDGTRTEEGKKRYRYTLPNRDGETDEQRHERYKRDSETNYQKLREGRDRYVESAMHRPNGDHHDGQDFFFTEDGFDPEVDEKEWMDKDSRDYLKNFTRIAADKAIEAQQRRSEGKSKLFISKAELESVEKKYKEDVDDYFADMFGETEDYVQTMPKKQRDAARAYVFELWGFNY